MSNEEVALLCQCVPVDDGSRGGEMKRADAAPPRRRPWFGPDVKGALRHVDFRWVVSKVEYVTVKRMTGSFEFISTAHWRNATFLLKGECRPRVREIRSSVPS